MVKYSILREVTNLFSRPLRKMKNLKALFDYVFAFVGLAGGECQFKEVTAGVG